MVCAAPEIETVGEGDVVFCRGGTEDQRSHDVDAGGGAERQRAVVVENIHRERGRRRGETAAVGSPKKGASAGSERAGERGEVALQDSAIEADEVRCGYSRRQIRLQLSAADRGRARVVVRAGEAEQAAAGFDDARRTGNTPGHDGVIARRGGIVIDFDGAVGAVQIDGISESNDMSRGRGAEHQGTDDLRTDVIRVGTPNERARRGAVADIHRQGICAGGEPAAARRPLECIPCCAQIQGERSRGVVLIDPAVEHDQAGGRNSLADIRLECPAVDRRGPRIGIRAGENGRSLAVVRHGTVAADDAAESPRDPDGGNESERSAALER